MKIAVCFYGLTRSLKHTMVSIDKNVLEPARNLGDVRVFAHFFDQERIENTRSRESSVLDRDEHRLLGAHNLELEKPDACLMQHDFEELKEFGDTRRDGFSSLRNLVHALHSLKKVTETALAWEPDIVIFARPDLMYHDSLESYVADAVNAPDPCIYIPDWQHWRGGYNDRFAICTSPQSALAYGTRVDRMLDFCRYFREAVHSESLNRFVLDNEGIEVRLMDARASRVRADGRIKKERFGCSKSDTVKTFIRQMVRRLRGTHEWVSNSYVSSQKP